MFRRIAPQFFTTDLATTFAYYQDVLGSPVVGRVARASPPMNGAESSRLGPGER